MYEFKEEKWRIGGNYLCSRLFSSLKLPVGWLDFLRKSPCCLGCGAQERCVRPDTKKAIWGPYLCVTSYVFWLRMSHVGCANRLGKKEKRKEKFGRNMVLMRNGKLIPACGNRSRFIIFSTNHQVRQKWIIPFWSCFVVLGKVKGVICSWTVFWLAVMVGELRSCFLDVLPGGSCVTVFAETATGLCFYLCVFYGFG